MIRRLTLACVGVAFCAAGATQLFAAGPQTAAAGNAVNYIRTIQNDDGGFPDFGATSSAGSTADAVFAIASTGIDPTTVTKNGKSPADFLAAQAPAYSASIPGAAPKLVLVAQTLDLDPTSFGGVNLPSVMATNYDAATGKYGGDPFAQAYFLLAEASLGTVPAGAVSFTEAAQKPSGGWEFCSVCGGEDTNTTALLVRALIAVGVPASDSHITSALAYLKASQSADGGFPYIAPGDSDANSTAYVIQAIVAAGQSVDVGGPWEISSGKTPLSSLLATQNPATGAIVFFGADSAFATYQAIPGLMLAAFPEQPADDQSEMLTAIAPTSTATPTATATTVPPTITPTTRPSTHTPTPRATATTAPASTIAATGTPVRGVLGESAAPTLTTSVLPSRSLPNAGSPSPAPAAEAWLLLLSGALALAGASLIWRGNRWRP